MGLYYINTKNVCLYMHFFPPVSHLFIWENSNALILYWDKTADYPNIKNLFLFLTAMHQFIVYLGNIYSKLNEKSSIICASNALSHIFVGNKKGRRRRTNIQNCNFIAISSFWVIFAVGEKVLIPAYIVYPIVLMTLKLLCIY